MRKNNVKMYVICNKKHQLTDREHLIKLSLYGFIYVFFVFHALVLLFQYFQTTLYQTQWHLYSRRVFGENVNMSANFPPCCPFLWDRCLVLQKFTSDICWVCKRRNGQVTNWPGKIKHFSMQLLRRLNFYWLKGKNPPGWASTGLLRRHETINSITYATCTQLCIVT